ncbi:MAG: hypothetical protein HXL68_10960 [Dechloromonas agitata]|uniref:Uncharacterized protein n=1 Tax=Dechloromonas agitata TaxID=73030 RepID=A0A930BTI3_9RHOO|nr:hypothetical protein [Dechloromonas agitata]
MSRSQLYPPIKRLHRELFSPLDTSEAPDPTPDLELAGDDTTPTPLPDFLREHIARTVAAQAAYPSAPPAVGQIRGIATVNTIEGQNSRPLGRSVGVLLGAHLGGKRWQGWLVTADTDYASDRDLLIEEEDGPADPLAGMIITRLPLRVMLQGDEPIFAKLSPARLGAVIALAEAPVGAEPLPSRPGHIFARNLDADHVGITGSPLGAANDPRHAYFSLHQRLADEMTAAADAKAPEATSQPTPSGLLGWFFSRRWAPAPVLAGVLALIVAQGLWLNAEDTESQRYRGQSAVTPPCAAVARLRVTFKTHAPQEGVVLLLRKAEARIVSGPSETGEWWLGVPTNAAAEQALALLQHSPLVADVIAIDTQGISCQP